MVCGVQALMTEGVIALLCSLCLSAEASLPAGPVAAPESGGMTSKPAPPSLWHHACTFLVPNPLVGSLQTGLTVTQLVRHALAKLDTCTYVAVTPHHKPRNQGTSPHFPHTPASNKHLHSQAHRPPVHISSQPSTRTTASMSDLPPQGSGKLLMKSMTRHWTID